MSWAENLLDASFRGVPLQVESESLQWQRALSEHGTPFKDGDRVKDLGRGARRVPMQVVVFGVNYEIELQN
ncbi:MAG: DNA circularization N-terminal domain-containing protein, partial [Pseudomonas sp.]